MLMEAVEKAGINGIITGAAAAGIFGTQAKVIAPMMNTTMPLYALVFLGGAASSLVTDALHVFTKDEIPISKKANDRTSAVIGLVVNGVVFAGLLELADPTIAADFGRLTAVAVGAASEFAAASSYTYLKETMYI